MFDRTCLALRRRDWQPETRFVNGYYDNAGYIDSLTASILKHWKDIGERSHLLFSYHGIPAVYVTESDPYQAQTTTQRVVSRLGLAADEWSHCYQSRFGPSFGCNPTPKTLCEFWRNAACAR